MLVKIDIEFETNAPSDHVICAFHGTQPMDKRDVRLLAATGYIVLKAKEEIVKYLEAKDFVVDCCKAPPSDDHRSIPV